MHAPLDLVHRQPIGHHVAAMDAHDDEQYLNPRFLVASNDAQADVDDFTGEKAEEDEIICFGALCNVRTRLSRTEGLGIVASPWIRFHECKLTERDGYLYLNSNSKTQDVTEIGVLNMADSGALIPLQSLQGVTFTAILTSQAMSRVTKKSGAKTFEMDVSINVMGPEKVFDQVGKRLTCMQHLQHPEYLANGVKYMNPQYFYRDGRPSDLRSLIGPSPQEKTHSLSFQELTNLMDGALVSNKYNNHIDHVLSKGLIKSTLKNHQRDGVNFILGREDAESAQYVTQSLTAGIDQRYASHPPELALGGIYADEMGLGKTLTMLSAILASSYLDSQVSEPMVIDSGLQTVKTTLIVVTAHQLIKVWESEIEKHLAPYLLNVGIFHGDKRARSLQDLHEKDIVLTTYHTLISDWNSKRLLHQTDDETKQYEEILTSAKEESENIANMKSNKKKHTVLFTTVMQLRRLCSHGLQQGDVQQSPQRNATELRLQVPKLGNKKRKRENVAFSRFCEDCCGGDLDLSLGTALREYCPTCCDSPPPGLDDDLVIESMSSSPMDLESSSASSPATGTLENQRAVPGLQAGTYLDRANPSSKISAVVSNVEDSPHGHKNLIFTCWRSTLDALQFELNRRGIPHLRIDGATSFLDRQRILSLFSEDPTQCTLLMTIGTGAVGLTITVANRVHLVEPQWNPSMEDQAMARVIRMGQEKRVAVFKYITKGTVEESIVELQQRKRRMARISLDGNDEDGGLEDYRFVLTNLQ
ncbi:hypothetical protein E8E14_006810 [Neopestalotiopsis sp. 37M]|nr:hypothetical protein E8E14_006810 [Neopestalotiopsis sp. 37M]